MSKPIPLKERLKAVHGIVNRLALAVVITVLCGIFIFPLFWNRKHAKAARKEMEEIGSALADYFAETGSWPAAGGRAVAQALAGGPKAFSKHERRAEDGRFIDPWETPFRYYFSEGSYAIQCAGDDGKFAAGADRGGDDLWYSAK